MRANIQQSRGNRQVEGGPSSHAMSQDQLPPKPGHNKSLLQAIGAGSFPEVAITHTHFSTCVQTIRCKIPGALVGVVEEGMATEDNWAS